MAKTARSRDLAGRVRQAFDKAIKNLQAGGAITDMSDIFQDMIAQDPFRAFDTLAKFIPKELLIEQETTHRIIAGEAMTPEEWEKQHVEPGAEIERTH